MTKEEAKEWLPRPTIISTNSDENHPDNKQWIAYEMAIKALEQAPKIGHWIPVDDENDAFDCSECIAMVAKKTNFCPRCGAKMVDP